MSSRNKTKALILTMLKELGLVLDDFSLTSSSHVKVKVQAGDGRTGLFVFGAGDSDPRREKNIRAALVRFVQNRAGQACTRAPRPRTTHRA